MLPRVFTAIALAIIASGCAREAIPSATPTADAGAEPKSTDTEAPSEPSAPQTELTLGFSTHGQNMPWALAWTPHGVDVVAGPNALRWSPEAGRVLARHNIDKELTGGADVRRVGLVPSDHFVWWSGYFDSEASTVTRGLAKITGYLHNIAEVVACAGDRCVVSPWAPRTRPDKQRVRIIDLHDGKFEAAYPSPGTGGFPVRFAAIDAAHAFLATQQTIFAMPADGSAPPAAVPIAGGPIQDIALVPGSSDLLVLRSRELVRYDSERGAVLATFELRVRSDAAGITQGGRLAVSSDGARVAVAIEPFLSHPPGPPDGPPWLQLFELSGGEACAFPDAPIPAALAFSPDGTRLAVAAGDEVRIVELSDCRAQ